MRKLSEKLELVAVILFVVVCHILKGPADKADCFVKTHRSPGPDSSGNSFHAIYSALREGATTIKMEVMVSDSGQILISHNPVTHQGYTHRKPLLGALIDSVENYVASSGIDLPAYTIEVQPNSSSEPNSMQLSASSLNQIINLVYEKSIVERVSVQSFELPHLQHLNRHHPDIGTSLLVDQSELKSVDHIIDELGFVPQVISPHYSLVDPELVTVCHNKGIKVIPWIVNDRNMINMLKELGVDGIITDFPHLFN